jgi:hypothetical protein
MAIQNSYVPLESELVSSLGPKLTFSTTDTPALFTSTSFIYSFAFVIIIVTASFRYALAGVLRMQASEEGIRKSKEEFKRVTFGLLGVLGLWLILFTVNKDMLTGEVGLENLKTDPIKATSNSSGITTGGNGGTTGGSAPVIPKNNDDPTGWKAISDDAGVRANLRNLSNGGISVNKSVCINPVQTSCTTVGGLAPETISMLSQLRSTCSGTITITGGSENGHSSHGVGKTPVDLSISSPGGLNDCIRAFPAGPAKNFCKKTYIQFGYIFCDELNTSPHWHVYKQ